MLDERKTHRSLPGGSSNFVSGGNDSGHPRCQTFGVEIDCRLGIDQQAVAAEDDYRLDSGPLTDGDREVANCRHQGSIDSGAMLGMATNLVNHIRLNCRQLQGIIENRDGSVAPLPLKQVMSTRKFALAVVASALGLAACGNPQGILAQLPTVADTYTVFALSGTGATLPSGINTYIRAAVRVDGNANFDVAFDLDASGKVLILPVQKVVNVITGGRSVAIRKVTGTFDQVTSAPTGAYGDSTIAAVPGDVIVVQALRNGAGDACQFDISPYIYAKLGIDSVVTSTRSIFVKAILDPNCGFRSFETGIPTR